MKFLVDFIVILVIIGISWTTGYIMGTTESIKTRFFVYHPHSYGIATLMRIGFRLPGGRSIFLHHFQPHAETEFHDHPWGFRTFVLWGGYTDESWVEAGEEGQYVNSFVTDDLHMGSFRRREALHAHRTCTDRHTWTIVLAGPKERDWCKGTPQKWVCEGEVADFDATRGMVKVDG